MPLSLLSLLPTVLKTVAKISGLDIFNQAADTVGNLQLSPDKQVELQEAVMAHEVAMRQTDVDSLKALVSEAIADAQSADKYVSRARPTGLYIAYAVTGAIIVSEIFGYKVDHAMVAELLVPLYGNAGYYMYLRTKEKMNGNGDEH